MGLKVFQRVGKKKDLLIKVKVLEIIKLEEWKLNGFSNSSLHDPLSDILQAAPAYEGVFQNFISQSVDKNK